MSNNNSLLPVVTSRLARLSAVVLGLLTAGTAIAATAAQAGEAQPRIVNIYNFVRENDFRLQNSEAILREATEQQIQVLKRLNLPATFALQYDALMDERYQKLFKAQGRNFEIAAWWEIPQLLAEKAGLKWRGKYEWDPEAHVGFSPGYTPQERRKLVDVYMADFQKIFGYYPKTVGSWFIDEVTLEYMAQRYGVIASCNCKDQIGTDFYTLWGGYWNQAYYPSRVNSYMPAQTKRGQIDMPVFRMLGSDPIYQHGITPGMFTLEPVYRDSGGSPTWLKWFMDSLIHEPSLAFAYTQGGQENSFGWRDMQKGFVQQVELFAKQAQAKEIRVETLAQSGTWFRKHFSVTPPTSVVALDDWKKQGRKTVWYDSRFYRLNVLWQDGSFSIRDLHCFDENIVSPTHETPLTATSLTYETLPVMDWAMWTRSGAKNVGMWPVLLSPDGKTSPLTPEGAPIVKELNTQNLGVYQPLREGGKFWIACAESKITFAATDKDGKPLRWAWQMVGGASQKSIVQSVEANRIRYKHGGEDYQISTAPNSGTFQQQANGDIHLMANQSGKIVLLLQK